VELPKKVRALLDDLRQHDSVLWRRAVKAGVHHGPEAFVRYSPPLFGLAFGAALPRHRRAVYRNIKRARGPRGPVAEAADVARVFSNFASCLTESFLLSGARKGRLFARCVNHDIFVRAASKGRGVILATAHTGGWQAAGPILCSVQPTEVLIVMQRERDERAQALQDDIRSRSAGRVVHVGDNPLDALVLLSHLRRQGAVAVQIDRLPRGMRGREVELFGEPWLMPEGPLLLASLSGAPIIPIFTRRLRFMEYEVVLGQPIEIARKASSEELDAAAGRIASEMEQFVRANPTQWFHFE
jgi:KDO2-lipid IV(A) lauroyltransferase